MNLLAPERPFFYWSGKMSEYTIESRQLGYLGDHEHLVYRGNERLAICYKYETAELLIDALEFKGADPDCSLIKEQAS